MIETLTTDLIGDPTGYGSRDFSQYGLMTDGAAQQLGQLFGPLDLSGLSSLSLAQARLLTDQIPKSLVLNGLVEIDEPLASQLSRAVGLSLDGLTQLSANEAKALRRTWVQDKKIHQTDIMGASLSLNGLKALSAEAALELGKVGGDLYLNGIEYLKPETARTLFQTFRICSTDNKLALIPWSGHRYTAEITYIYNFFHLQGLVEIDLHVASEMVRFGGTVVLGKNCNVSEGAKNVLKDSKSVRGIEFLSEETNESPQTTKPVGRRQIGSARQTKWWQFWAR